MPRLLALPLAVAAAALSLTATCSSADEPGEAGVHISAQPIVSAHRGGAAYAPENTMPAFRNAVRLRVDQLETDTQLTKDGRLVLIHDDTLDRTTNCSGAVHDHTYAQIKKCDAAYWFSPGQGTTDPDKGAPHPLRGTGVHVPLAVDLFRYVNSLGKRAPSVSIEIKDIPGENNFDPTALTVAHKLVAMIQRTEPRDVIVQSFWPQALDTVKLLDASIRTQLLSQTTVTYALTYAVSHGHNVIAPTDSSPDLTPETVRASHLAGKDVIVWTPDKRADQKAAIATGVDGVISNWPACTLALEGRSAPEPGFGLNACPP